MYTCVILRDVLYGGRQLVGMDTLLPHGYGRMDIEPAHKKTSGTVSILMRVIMAVNEVNNPHSRLYGDLYCDNNMIIITEVNYSNEMYTKFSRLIFTTNPEHRGIPSNACSGTSSL